MLTVLKAIRSIAGNAGGRRAVAFCQDKRAVAAVEFAMIVSVLLMVLLGLADVVPSWLVYTNVGSAASTAADVAAEFSEMRTSDMVNVFSAAANVMAPFSSTNQSLRITNVFSNGNGSAMVYWSCATGSLSAYSALSTVTSTPTGSPTNWFIWVNNSYGGGYQRNGTNTSYIVAEASFTYTAPAQFVLRSPITMSAVSYYLPRSSSYVGFPWDGVATDSPTLPTSATTSSSIALSNGASCNYAH